MSKKSKRGSVQGHIVRENGTCYMTPSTDASGNVIVSVNAASLGTYSAKLAQLAECFLLYRFTSLRVEIPASSGLVPSAIGYSPPFSSTPPTTTAQVMDLPWSWLIRDVGTSAAFTTMSQSRLIAKRELLVDAIPKWWKCTASGSYDDLLEYQGVLAIRGQASTAQAFALHWSAEFTQFTPPAYTPKLLQVQESKEESSEEDSISLASLNTGLPGKKVWVRVK